MQISTDDVDKIFSGFNREDLSNKKSNEVKKKLKPEEHYFKVDEKILKIPAEALSKKELLVYLLHCRACNPDKFLGCSVAGHTRARKVFGLPEEAYQKAAKGLEEKFFIKARYDVKTGIYRSSAIEVLNFPEYKKGERKFCIDKRREDNHRRNYRDTKFIRMPSKIIDGGCLKGLKLQDIWAILWLYSYLNIKDELGVTSALVHAYSPECKNGYISYKVIKFGEGFHKSIYQKKCMEVANHEKYWFSEELDNFQGDPTQAFNNLVDRQLFEYVPVLVEWDEEDSDIVKTKAEIFQGMVHFEGRPDSQYRYLLVKPEKNQKIIWIMRPTIPVIDVAYQFYQERRKKHFAIQEKIYRNYDIRTSMEKKKDCLNEEDFEIFLSDCYCDEFDNVSEYLEARHEKMQRYDGIEKSKLEERIRKKLELIDDEDEKIKQRNKRSGERKRTSPIKKQLKKELDELEKGLSYYESLEMKIDDLDKKIIKNIPDKVFLHYKNYQEKVS